jgi:uncharacterized protein YndB with AHSA1/START domain
VQALDPLELADHLEQVARLRVPPGTEHAHEALGRPPREAAELLEADRGVDVVAEDCRVRVGGRYRLVFSHAGSTMEFFGRYLEVTPHSRLVWTNDEGDDSGAVTTVTFEEKGGQTLLVVRDLYPSKEALDGAIASGATAGMPEALNQLDELLVTLGASGGRS